MKIVCPPADLDLGVDAEVDDDVILGYPTGREIDDRRLRIGAGARLRSGTVIYAGSRFGARLETGHHVVIREQVEAGERLSVWTGTVIDYGCRLGDRVKLHTNVYVAQYTTIEDDVFLAPGVTIANDLHPGRDYSLRRMRGPHLGRGAQLGVNVTVLPFITIGPGALIGAGSVVTRDVPADALAYGNPARVWRRASELGEADLERWLDRGAEPPGDTSN